MPGEERPESVRVVLDLDLAGDGPSGRLVDEVGSSSAFFGWLQLMDGLEGVRQRAAASGEPDTSGGDDERPRPSEAASGS
ncbi:MAG: hypothetical protein ACRDL1_09570 [Solirubrobacterales bacterium]